MWNCNFGYPFAHGGWFMGHGPFGPLMGILVLVLIVYLAVLIFRSVTGRRKAKQDSDDSLEIVKTRYARGEITEEEYHRIREILTG